MAAPVVLRIKLRYDDVDTLVLKFAANVGKSGLFLPTKSIQPIGTEIKFELRLANDTPVLVGLGTVRAAREPDPANPKAAFGIAIELQRVTREGREVILKMLERRRQLGLAEVHLPMPDDVDAARRAEVEHTSVRDTTFTGREISADPVVPTPGDALLTAPRRGTGTIGVAKRAASGLVVAPLAPEPSRRVRPRVSEVIARAHEASGAMIAAIAVPGLDEEVDVARAMARAHVLAASAGDVDAELEALRDAVAAPLAEISVEAASAELARQLGGAPVRRDRSAGWAPPPAVVQAPMPVSMPASVPVADVGPVSMPVHAIDVELESAPVHTAPIAAPPAEDEAIEAADELIESESPEIPSGILIHDDADPSKLLRAVSAPVALIDPADLDSELDELDDDRGESTQIGAMPMAPEAYETQPAVHDPGDPEMLAARLEAHLAAAEAAAEAAANAADADHDDDDLSPPLHEGFAPPSEDAEYETAPADAALAEAAAATEAAALAAAQALADEPIGDDDEDIEEIDDFEILAEADADDADLLAADGESEMSGTHQLPPPAPEHLDDDEPDEIEPPVAATTIAPAPTAAHPTAPQLPAASASRPVKLPGITGGAGARTNDRRPTALPTSDFDFSALDLGDEESRPDARRLPRMHSEEVDMASLEVPESAEDAGFDRPISYPVVEDSRDDAHAFDAPSYAEREREVARRIEPIVPRLTPAANRARVPTGSVPAPAPPVQAAPPRRVPRAARAGLDLDSALEGLDDAPEDGVQIDFDDDDAPPKR